MSTQSLDYTAELHALAARAHEQTATPDDIVTGCVLIACAHHRCSRRVMRELERYYKATYEVQP